MRIAPRRVLVACAIAIAIAGCKQDQAPEPQTSAPSDTGTPSATAPPAVPDQPSQSGADLGVANSAEHGKYLVDATGKTLYMMAKDAKGTSSCSDACATQWPPLLGPS